MQLDVTMADGGQESTLTATAADATGQGVPATFSWVVDNSSVVQVAPSADTTSCLCTSGSPGTATVTCSAGGAASAAVFTVTAGTVAEITLSASQPAPPAA